MDIAALIRSTKGRRSYERLADDCGGKLTAARLQQIATKPPREFPEPATIRALTLGLRVGERHVILAWAESLGLDVGESQARLAQLLPPSAADLDDDQTAAVLAVVNAMNPKGREGDGHQPAAKSEAEGTSAQDAANDMAARERAESTDSEAPGRAPHSHTQSGASRSTRTPRDGGTAESTTP